MGNEGDDSISGSLAAEIYGNQGSDWLEGGLGIDTIFAGQDNDTIFNKVTDSADIAAGNKGADLFWLSVAGTAGSISAGGRMTITDFTTEDTLLISNAATSITVTALAITSVSDAGGDVTLKHNGGSIVLKGIGDGSLNDVDDLLQAGYNIDFA